MTVEPSTLIPLGEVWVLSTKRLSREHQSRVLCGEIQGQIQHRAFPGMAVVQTVGTHCSQPAVKLNTFPTTATTLAACSLSHQDPPVLPWILLPLPPPLLLGAWQTHCRSGHILLAGLDLG